MIKVGYNVISLLARELNYYRREEALDEREMGKKRSIFEVKSLVRDGIDTAD